MNIFNLIKPKEQELYGIVLGTAKQETCENDFIVLEEFEICFLCEEKIQFVSYCQAIQKDREQQFVKDIPDKFQSLKLMSNEQLEKLLDDFQLKNREKILQFLKKEWGLNDFEADKKLYEVRNNLNKLANNKIFKKVLKRQDKAISEGVD